MDNANKTFTIQFTAPGDDLDHGTVTRYEIKYSSNYDDLREKNFPSGSVNATIMHDVLDVINGPIQPAESGAIESISFQPAKMSRGVTYYVALRGIDEAGNSGQASNIVSIRFEEDVSGNQGGLSTKVIIGISIGAVLLAILVAMVIFLVIRKRKNSHQPVSTTDDQSNKA